MVLEWVFSARLANLDQIQVRHWVSLVEDVSPECWWRDRCEGSCNTNSLWCGDFSLQLLDMWDSSFSGYAEDQLETPDVERLKAVDLQSVHISPLCSRVDMQMAECTTTLVLIARFWFREVLPLCLPRAAVTWRMRLWVLWAIEHDEEECCPGKLTGQLKDGFFIGQEHDCSLPGVDD